MYQIQFEGDPEGFADMNEPASLLEAGSAAGVPLKARCHGHARCGTCLVTIVDGAEHLDSPAEPEARILSILKAGPDKRLACQACASGDVRCRIG